jgi:hypothetical protein
MNVAKLNRSHAIESRAASVLSTFAYDVPPVDVREIAAAEGIFLAEGDYGPNFFGRIEYHLGARKFILYHPILSSSSIDYWQTRFSVAHELGHYYIAEHRKLLIQGKEHSSEPGFVCDNEMEREADLFASALLIPESAVKGLWRPNKLSIKRVLELSARCETSAVAAALRSTRGSEETAVMALSQNGKILFAGASDEARARRFGWIETIPEHSPTASATRASSNNNIFEATVRIQSWFENSSDNSSCWEEAMRLGRTDLVLTLLIMEEEEEEGN